MGAGGSKEAALLPKKKAFTPDERRDLRRNVYYNPDEEYTSSIEHSADKYDYLLMFPKFDSKKALPVSDATSKTYSWTDAEALWLKCIPGDDRIKDEAVELFRASWVREFSSELTTVDFGQYVELIRTNVVDILSQRTGLQLKRKKRGSTIYYRIRAPIRVLESHAQAIAYVLQLRPEVDPGYEFWNETEIQEEQIEYSRDKAEEILEELFHVGKISPNDLTIFDEEVLPRQWSRRIHTLERIADKVPVKNRFPAHAEFNSDPKLRHLYQTYPSVRGRTLFKSKDRLFLTNSIIRSYIDLSVLEVQGIIRGITALHDASRGEQITADMLVKRWVTPWKEHLNKVGAPMLSDPAIDVGNRPWAITMLFCQPLEDIRDYFGEKIAIYFAWIGFYCWSLFLPALIGLGLQIYYYMYDVPTSEGINYYQIAGCVLMCIWSSIFKKTWDRELKIISLKWGLEGVEENESDRPEFYGDINSGDKGRKRSIVTNHMETYYPEEQRAVRQVGSSFVVLISVVISCAFIEGVMLLWYELDKLNVSYAEEIAALVMAVAIRILSECYKFIATKLNDLENYRTDTHYENALILKTIIFQVFNNYGALLFVAFLKGFLYGCGGDDSTDCMTDLEIFLIIIFCVRIITDLFEILAPLLGSMLKDAEDDISDDASTSSGGSLGGPEGSASDLPRDEFELEVNLEVYDGTFDDYASIIIQYGYVVIFFVAFPLLPLLALLENLVYIRSGAFKLTRLSRRPTVEAAEDIGMWSYVLDALGYIGVLSSVGIICFTGDALYDYDLSTKWLIFLVAEQALTLLKVAIQILVPEEPEYISESRARNQFVVNKHVFGHNADDSASGGSSSKGKAFGEIDIDSLTLEGMVKSTGDESTEEREKRLQLETRKKEIETELSIVKEQLQQAMQTEVFNEKTQVGETKYGLPLGFINIQLLALDDVGIKDEDCIVVISVRSTKADKTPPGPPPKHSQPAKRSDNGEQLIFNQAFQLAPIRTQDAEIIFDVLNRNADPSKVGSVRVELRELASQETQSFSKVLMTSADKSSSKSHATKGVLYFKARFQYSKVVPLRKKIYVLADQKRSIEKEITLLKVGKLKK